MTDEIKVNLSLEGADIFLRDLKTIQAELEKTIELRNRALLPRWWTRLKRFIFGQKIRRVTETGEDAGWIGIAPGWKQLILWNRRNRCNILNIPNYIEPSEPWPHK